MVPLTHCLFSDHAKIAGKVSKKHVQFSSLHLLCNLLQLLFSAFITASSSIFFEYVKPDDSFCYQVLVEVCMFLMFSTFVYNAFLLHLYIYIYTYI